MLKYLPEWLSCSRSDNEIQMCICSVCRQLLGNNTGSCLETGHTGKNLPLGSMAAPYTTEKKKNIQSLEVVTGTPEYLPALWCVPTAARAGGWEACSDAGTMVWADTVPVELNWIRIERYLWTFPSWSSGQLFLMQNLFFFWPGSCVTSVWATLFYKPSLARGQSQLLPEMHL